MELGKRSKVTLLYIDAEVRLRMLEASPAG
jgi:hypothetical protein